MTRFDPGLDNDDLHPAWLGSLGLPTSLVASVASEGLGIDRDILRTKSQAASSREERDDI